MYVGKRYFHGTRAQVAVGKELIAADKLGFNNGICPRITGEHDTSSVYFTTEIDIAQAAGNHSTSHSGPVRILEVFPQGQINQVTENIFKAPSALVVGVVVDPYN